VPGIQWIDAGVKTVGFTIEFANADVPPASNATAATTNAKSQAR
jgi:hypothetical protein